MHRGEGVCRAVTRRRARAVFGDRPLALWRDVVERASRNGIEDSRKGLPVAKLGACLRARETGCNRNHIEPCELNPNEGWKRQCLISSTVVREAAFVKTRAPINSVESTEPRNRFRENALGAGLHLRRVRRASDQGLFMLAIIIDAPCTARNQTASMGMAEMGSFAGISNASRASCCEVGYFGQINPLFEARNPNIVEPEQFKVVGCSRQLRSAGLVANGLEQLPWQGGAVDLRNDALTRVEGLERNRVLSIPAKPPVRSGTACREREKCAYLVAFLAGARPPLRAIIGLWEAPCSRTAKEKA